jgi:phosphatidylglycerophosphatase A
VSGRRAKQEDRFRPVLWLAEGFGLGRLPRAPGTFGSVAGVRWFALLLASGSLWVYLGGLIAGFFFSVWCCGIAEKMLQKTDPPSVVLDEIVAVPLCFAAWVAGLYAGTGVLPSPWVFFASGTWLSTVGVVLLFRLFDIVKPWPVRQSQALPGGWGITVDDMLAAVYVNLVVLALRPLKGLIAG